MGLTKMSTGNCLLYDSFDIDHESKLIALAGNPNVGKSTIFNALTGLNQHTGNWPGKTVTSASGSYEYKDNKYTLIDLPGTYSLFANSAEEEVARDFICFEKQDLTIVVLDATSLERNLNLALQVIEANNNVLLCINLLDEAAKKNIKIDLKKLSETLMVPVIGTTATDKKSLNNLIKEIEKRSNIITYDKEPVFTYSKPCEDVIKKVMLVLQKNVNSRINTRFLATKLIENNKELNNKIYDYLKLNKEVIEELNKVIESCISYLESNGISDYQNEIVTTIINESERINKLVSINKNNKSTQSFDKLITSKIFGIPLMLLFLGIIFWITITGANYPSELLSNLFSKISDYLSQFLHFIKVPTIIHDILVFGIFKTLAWVISVMLPPMAIFFPLFTLLEDSGVLPRIAFNLDKLFKKAKCHGKQALTMCMGFGCNACGIVGCRIIDSPRERLIAILTNNFVPCNGRFPTLIAIISMFFAVGTFSSFSSTLILVSIILLGIIATLVTSKILSKTILKGMPSSFVLELPPYRKPQFGKVIFRSIFDRTLFVLGRAISIAIPAGLLIWIMANVKIGNTSILSYCTNFLDPFASMIGLDGTILMAFILGLPANEIVIPIILMSYLATGSLTDYSSLSELKTLLLDNGWTTLTAICTLIFTLMHFPCGTTLLTIKKETGSTKWTLLSFIIPTVVGIGLCFIITTVSRLI